MSSFGQEMELFFPVKNNIINMMSKEIKYFYWKKIVRFLGQIDLSNEIILYILDELFRPRNETVFSS